MAIVRGELATPTRIWRLRTMRDTMILKPTRSEVDSLESGWLASTPDGDNIVTDTSRAQSRAYHALATAGGYATAVDAELGLSLSDTQSASPFGNVAVLSRPLTVDATRLAVSAMRDFYGSADGGPFIIFSAWPTLELDAEGFTLAGHPPLMVRWEPDHNPNRFDADVREVGCAAELEDFERTLVESYPAPELLPWDAGCFLGPEALESSWKFFVVYDGGAPVGTAASFATSTVTLIEMVAVKGSARGKGLGSAVTAAAAGSDPSRPAVLISSDLGRPVYTRLGFTTINRFTCLIGRRRS